MKISSEIIESLKGQRDSLFVLKSDIDSGKYTRQEMIIKMLDLAWRTRYSDPNLSKDYSSKALTFSQSSNYKKGNVYARLLLGINRFIQNDNNEFLLNEFLELTNIFKEYSEEWGCFVSRIFISKIYELLGEYENGAEALRDLLIEIKDKSLDDIEAEAYIASGNLFYRKKDYKNAVTKYNSALKLKEKADEYYGYSTVLDLLGRANIALKEYDQAFEYYQNSLKIKEAVQDQTIVNTYIGLAAYSKRKGDLQGVKEFYGKAFETVKKRDKYSQMLCYYGRGHFNLEQKLYPEAISDFEEALKIAKTSNIRNKISDIFSALSSCYERTGKPDKALSTYKEFHKYKADNDREIFSFRANYDELFNNNKELIDSINYASRIQTALLPSNKYIQSLLAGHMLYFRPQNIVSGDFVWLGEKNDKIIIILADCTGHGIPGSFLSMLGIAYLGEIVSKMNDIKACDILDQLRQKIVTNFSQFREDPLKDGMTMTICILDRTSSIARMQYAGAQSPAYFFRDSSHEDMKYDKMPIGHWEKMDPFRNNEFDLKKGDIIYLFSDGYRDQLGGEKSGKMGGKKFRELLYEIHTKPFTEQLEILDTKHKEWKSFPDQLTGKPFNQTDDISVFAFRI